MQQECPQPSMHKHLGLSTETWKEMYNSLPRKAVVRQVALHPTFAFYVFQLLLHVKSHFDFLVHHASQNTCHTSLVKLPTVSVNAPQLILPEALAHETACRLGQHLLEEPNSCLLWPCAETVCFLIQVHPHVQSSRVPRLCEQLVTWYVWLP